MPDEEKARNERSVETILGSPVFIGSDERTDKVRGHLIFAATISLFVTVADLHFGSDSSFLGLEITGLTDRVAYIALLFFVGYQLVHYVWCAWDTFLEWRLRITGKRTAFITTARFASEEGDYPSDPRQSTLYNWWIESANKIGHLQEGVTEINDALQRVERSLDGVRDSSLDPNSVTVIRSQLSPLQNTVQRLAQAFEACKQTIASARIPASLKRFDNWFKLFLSSQNLRWLIFNLLIPILLSVAAMILLAAKIRSPDIPLTFF